MLESIIGKLSQANQWGIVAVGEAKELANLVTPQGAPIQLRVIDGANAHTYLDFMHSLWKPLEMPSYFGENWSAVDDCLHDMSWLRADSYIIVFTNAEQLLGDTPRDLMTLMEILRDVHLDWADPERPGFVEAWTTRRKDVFFVFQVSQANKALIDRRLIDAGAELPTVALPDLLGDR